jgi:protein-disulfide isomerase
MSNLKEKTMKMTPRFSRWLLAASLSLGVSLQSGYAKDIARVGNTTLTEEQMRSDMGMQVYQMENAVYNMQKAWVDEKAQQYIFDLAAKEAKMSRKDWEAKEIDAKVQPVNDAEAQSYAGRFAKPGVDSMETIRLAKEQLAMRNKQMRRQQLYQELQAKYPVQMLIQKPEAPKVNVTYSPNDPVKGNMKAPVTIVEFTDFQCPFCKRAAGTMHELEAAYPDKLKVVARQYPLPFHDRGKPAAVAALCAHDQGKYWEYRDKLFAEQKLSDEDLRKYAKELNLNEKKFERCLKDGKQIARIENDMKDGSRFGVSGTPAFFINGEFLSGAQPIENFKTAVDNALAKAK